MLYMLVTTIVLINLLIAMMSDTYSGLAEVKVGLYWALVINEMPKLAYDKHYGALSIFPFPFAWLSFLSMPFLILIKHKQTL